MKSGRTEDWNNPSSVQRSKRAILIGIQSADFIKASGHNHRTKRPDIWKQPTKAVNAPKNPCPRRPSTYGRYCGERTARKQGQPRHCKLDPHRDYILGLIAATPDLTISELLVRLLAERGVRAARATLWTKVVLSGACSSRAVAEKARRGQLRWLVVRVARGLVHQEQTA